MNCESVAGQLALMLYGELSFDEEELLQQHLDACEACRSEFVAMQRLHTELDLREIPVDSNLLTSCRRTLRISVAQIAHERASRGDLLTSVRGWFNSAFLAGAWKPASAALLLAAGFFLGRVTPQDKLRPIPVSEPIAQRVRYLSPVEKDGKVQIVLEEVRERTLSGEIADSKIRNYVLTAAREAQDPGMRVESVELLKPDVASQDVRRALIYALQNDPNPGVRLKALEGLRAAAHEPETRRALSHVVLADDNPGIRTQAIDLLVEKKEPSMVGVLQELMERENNTYVRMKCQKALREMKASVETF